nr:nuclear pore complex protein NUP1-like isoform X2 [Tanacetum cinerariifolium]
MIGCEALKIHFKYLGIMTGSNMNRLHTWDRVIEKVMARLSKWKEKALSISSRSNFFRGVESGSRKVSWFSWDSVVASKDVGGLGMSRFLAMNRALLFKWIWRFKVQPDAMWVSIIKAIHGGQVTWIAALRWLVEEQDKWVWNLEGDGVFKVASARHFIDEGLSEMEGVQTRWVKLVPIKFNVFAWRLALNKLLTRFNMSSKGLEVWSIVCPVCNVGAEMVDHLFFSCPVASSIMAKALQRTIEFEEELAKNFGDSGSSRNITDAFKEAYKSESNNQIVLDIRKEYEKKLVAYQGNQDDDKDIAVLGAGFNFRGIISSCFEPHLMVDEIERLATLLHSRTTTSDFGEGEQANISNDSYMEERENFHAAFEEDVASSAELEKAYMGASTRPAKVSPSTLRHGRQVARQDSVLLNNTTILPRMPITSLAPRTTSSLKGVENGMTTPRSRGRSAIYSMARSPYYRGPSTLRKKPTPSLISSQLVWELEGSNGNKMAGKHMSSILDDLGSGDSSAQRLLVSIEPEQKVSKAIVENGETSKRAGVGTDDSMMVDKLPKEINDMKLRLTRWKRKWRLQWWMDMVLKLVI